MGPIKGGVKKRRKRKAENNKNKVDSDASLASLPVQPQSLDWWDDFSKRITGKRSVAKSSGSSGCRPFGVCYFDRFASLSSCRSRTLLLLSLPLSLGLVILCSIPSRE